MYSKDFHGLYKPKDGILVVQPVWITEKSILMQYNAPFIGKEATLCMRLLYGVISIQNKGEVFSILVSMTANLGMPDFYLAKTRLEELDSWKRIVRNQVLHVLKRTRWSTITSPRLFSQMPFDITVKLMGIIVLRN